MSDPNRTYESEIQAIQALQLEAIPEGQPDSNPKKRRKGEVWKVPYSLEMILRIIERVQGL